MPSPSVSHAQVLVQNPLLAWADSLRPTIEEKVFGSRASARDLELQSLLHLPRLARDRQTIDETSVSDELNRLLTRIEERKPHELLSQLRPEKIGTKLADAHLRQVSTVFAKDTHERLHYLWSYREDARHFALFERRGCPLCLISISPMDLPHVLAAIPANVSVEEVAVVSRMYSFPWAPRNTLSFTMARISKATLKEGVKVLITYVNPNMGFTGASYRGMNWVLLGREADTRYAYLDKDYVTDRYLERQFGTADAVELQRRLGDRFSLNLHALAPLQLYVYFPERKLRKRFSADFRYELRRNAA